MGITKPAAAASNRVKGAAKALAGYPGIFHHLAGEHAELETMMKRVAGTSNDSDVRTQLFPRIRENLLAHARAEEAEIYPQLREFPELEVLVAQCRDEHRTIESYLTKLENTDIRSGTWLARFDELMQAVQSHAEVEESELFPWARALLEGDEAREMLDGYERVEEREKSRLQ